MQNSSKAVSRLLAIPLLAAIAVLGVAGSQPALRSGRTQAPAPIRQRVSAP